MIASPPGTKIIFEAHFLECCVELFILSLIFKCNFVSLLSSTGMLNVLICCWAVVLTWVKRTNWEGKNSSLLFNSHPIRRVSNFRGMPSQVTVALSQILTCSLERYVQQCFPTFFVFRTPFGLLLHHDAHPDCMLYLSLYPNVTTQLFNFFHIPPTVFLHTPSGTSNPWLGNHWCIVQDNVTCIV